MFRITTFLITLAILQACSIPDMLKSGNQNTVIHYRSLPDMKTGITPAGMTRVPENANSGQKLYLNPVNDAMMLCALVDEVTDTCLRFYRR